MAYNENLSDRIREALSNIPKVEEKYMFGGVCYMVNGKMCIGVAKDEMMCRIGTAAYESALENPDCRPMDFTGKPMKGYVFVNKEGLKTKRQFDFWINLCLQYNSEIPSKKKKRKR